MLPFLMQRGELSKQQMIHLQSIKQYLTFEILRQSNPSTVSTTPSWVGFPLLPWFLGMDSPNGLASVERRVEAFAAFERIRLPSHCKQTVPMDSIS
jgi:hypothetical protein